MYARPLYLAALLAAVTTFFGTPTAAAQPKCASTTPNTTQCERAGNTQIVTTPGTSASTAAFPFPEWPWGLGGPIGIG
jgi:hypothetical protein